MAWQPFCHVGNFGLHACPRGVTSQLWGEVPSMVMVPQSSWHPATVKLQVQSTGSPAMDHHQGWGVLAQLRPFGAACQPGWSKSFSGIATGVKPFLPKFGPRDSCANATGLCVSSCDQCGCDARSCCRAAPSQRGERPAGLSCLWSRGRGAGARPHPATMAGGGYWLLTCKVKGNRSSWTMSSENLLQRPPWFPGLHCWVP